MALLGLVNFTTASEPLPVLELKPDGTSVVVKPKECPKYQKRADNPFGVVTDCY